MADPRRDFVKYTFYRVQPEWRRLPAAEREAGKDEFAAVAAEHSDRVALNTYTLVGARGDTDFMLWGVCPELEPINEMAARLNGTRLGGYLETPHSYLGMTRRSPYIDDHQHEGQDGAGDAASLRPSSLRMMGRRYLFMYPFWKTHDWYQLPKDTRQEMMNEHFVIGHKYPQVKISTAYSFGLDDPEFILGFETDEPGAFLDLVMDLRESKARPYTLKDTPIFSCINRPLRDCLDDAA